MPPSGGRWRRASTCSSCPRCAATGGWSGAATSWSCAAGWRRTSCRSAWSALEPAPARLRQPIERRYRLGGTSDAAQARYEPHGTVVLDDDADEVEPVIGREIDLGEAFAEELGARAGPLSARRPARLSTPAISVPM